MTVLQTQVPIISNPSGQELIAAVTERGAVIVNGFVSPEQLDTINSDCADDFIEYKNGNIFALKTGNTEIAYNIAAKSKTYVDSNIMNEEVYKTVFNLLRNDYEVYWGTEMKKHLTPPVLSSAYAIKTFPGFCDQPLHRGDAVDLHQHKSIKSWNSEENDKSKREAVLTSYLAGSDDISFLVILDSYCWDDNKKPEKSKATIITLKKGQILFLLGSTYFAYSGNIGPEAKLLYLTSFCRGIYRQEQNMFLTVPFEILRTYGEKTAKRIGYDMGNPFLGWVDLKDPLNLVFPETVSDGNPTDLN
jgi:ectoine hydroxylase-related dioxygenase (phytanoyl-CoA dioxygenase family)